MTRSTARERAPTSVGEARRGGAGLGAWRGLVVAAGLLAGGWRAAAQPAPDPAAVLLALESDEAARRAAADRMVASADWAALEAALRGGPAGVRDAVCAAIGASAAAPGAALQRAIIEAAEKATPGEARAIVQALGRCRSREAVRATARFITEPSPPGVVEAAVAALVRQTGRDDLGTDAAQWREWWRTAQFLPPGEWAEAVAGAQSARAARLEAERNALSQQLVDAQRRLYALTPAEERPALLVRLMNSTDVSVRLLAFELAERALLDAKRLDGAVADASVARLADERPRVRAAAAALLGRLAPSDAPTRLMEALAREREPAPAAAMLDALARWPSPSVAEAAIEWLERAEPAASAAARALLAASRRGALDDAGRRAACAAALRRTLDSGALTPAMVGLLGALGNAADRERMESLLRSSSAEVRVAAGEALAEWPDSAPAVLGAAAHDASLFDAAVSAAALHRSDAEGFALVAAMPAVSADQRSAGLRRLAQALTPAEAIAAARGAAARADGVLALRAAFDGLVAVEGEAERGARVRAALAEILLEAWEFDAALAVLDRSPVGVDGLDAELLGRLTSARVVSLACLGRLDEAERVSKEASAWERAAALARASGRVEADRIEARIEAMRVGATPQGAGSDNAGGPPPAGQGGGGAGGTDG